jgi:hypothetical protein
MAVGRGWRDVKDLGRLLANEPGEVSKFDEIDEVVPGHPLVPPSRPSPKRHCPGSARARPPCGQMTILQDKPRGRDMIGGRQFAEMTWRRHAHHLVAKLRSRVDHLCRCQTAAGDTTDGPSPIPEKEPASAALAECGRTPAIFEDHVVREPRTLVTGRCRDTTALVSVGSVDFTVSAQLNASFVKNASVLEWPPLLRSNALLVVGKSLA